MEHAISEEGFPILGRHRTLHSFVVMAAEPTSDVLG